MNLFNKPATAKHPYGDEFGLRKPKGTKNIRIRMISCPFILKSKRLPTSKNPNKDFFLTRGHKKAKIFRIRKMNHVRTAQDLGILLRQRRKIAGLTIEELAATLPCSPRLLDELERGKPRASILLVLRLMELLGLNLTVTSREEESNTVFPEKKG